MAGSGTHRPTKVQAVRALKRRTRALVTTEYNNEDLVLPSKKEYYHSRAWYWSYKAWCEQRTPQSLGTNTVGIYRTAFPIDYYLYYLQVLRK